MFPGLFFDNITVDNISSAFNKGPETAILRLDKLHPVISGNKWFKLRYHLEEAKKQKKTHIITFGGAWSNHIVATAAACRMSGLSATGIIRGEEPALYSPALSEAKAAGMKLVFVSREAYKNKPIPPALQSEKNYLIHEGGYGMTGAKGAATLLDYCDKDYTHYCCAAGTGTMMAGLISAAPTGSHVTGISVMKNNTALESSIQNLLAEKNSPTGQATWNLLHPYHFGGYAKYTPALIAWMNAFYSQTGIPSDFVYTGKLLYAVNDLIENNFFPAGSKLLVVHSGGLQGNRSLPAGTLLF